MSEDKLLRMIGLCCRAGKIDAGEAKAEDRVRHKKSELIIISSDASCNTLKKFENLSKLFGIDLIKTGDRESLGKYTGRDFAVVLSVSDSGFAKRIKELADTNI